MNRLLVMILFASLPFFSVRALTGGYSLTLWILIVIFVLSAGRIKKLDGIEMSELALLVLAALSVVSAPNPGAFELWAKTLIYFAAFVALRRHLVAVGRFRSVRLAITGIQIGIAGYLMLAVTALAASGDLVGIFNDIGYHTFTTKIHRSIADLVGFNEDFQGQNIMRNTMGEVFALAVILPVAFASNRRITGRDWVFIGIAFLMVVATFSRRAMIVVAFVTVVCSGAMSWQMRGALISSFATMIYVLFHTVGIDNRFSDIEESTRLHQYGEAITTMIQNPITGEGYGAMPVPVHSFMDSSFVHNYVLSSGYMLGVLGFIAACAVLYFMSRQMIHIRYASYTALLVLPVTGLMVGSTRTPAAWLVLALVLPSVVNNRNSKQVAKGIPE